MKKLLLIILAVLMLSGCAEMQTYTPPAPKCYLITEKGNDIDNRFSAGDFFFGNGSVTKSETVYFLILEDGNIVEVDRGEYYKYKVGENYCN